MDLLKIDDGDCDDGACMPNGWCLGQLDTGAWDG